MFLFSNKKELMLPTMFTAYGDSEKIFKKDSRITFDKFLVNTDDSFDLEEGIFKANKGGYYAFSFFAIQVNPKHETFPNDFARIQVLVDRKPILKFLNYEHSKKTGPLQSLNGLDTISFAFNLKLNKGQHVELFVERGQIKCDDDANCVFNGRFVRPLRFKYDDK